MTFTTRPDLTGTFGMVASTHWLATAAGMKMLEAGGTAADAAVAAGFVLNVVEPHLNGPLGDLPILVRPPLADEPVVICGQGSAPAGATIAHYRAEGLTRIPGAGLLATVVPGAFDAWMVLLRDHGRLELSQVMEPAIHYARHGHPVLPKVSAIIAALRDVFLTEWPTSAPVWLVNGQAPAAGSLFRNPDLAATWTRLLAEAAAAQGGREARIEAARRAFYSGFVAEAIDDFLRDACVLDQTGARRRGVLTGADMAAWQATTETAVAGEHAGWRVFKPGFWSQGPVLLQALSILSADDIAALDPRGADFVHLVTEALKLSLADRDAYYGDPAQTALPEAALLSAAYAAARRAQITPEASQVIHPGAIAGHAHWAEALAARLAEKPPPDQIAGIGGPTLAPLIAARGDTCHVNVTDRWGGIVSATPSGGWLKSSPVVPGLGAPLNTRAQMFCLEPGLPGSLAPHRRPRTTLSPSMARRQDGRWVSFGTPGGDQQDQWQLAFFLRMAHHAMTPQQAIEAPLFHTSHLQSSFYPRGARPGHLAIEETVGPDVLRDLAGRGHGLEVSPAWSIGRLVATGHDGDARADAAGGRILHAAASPRLVQAYAAGR